MPFNHDKCTRISKLTTFLHILTANVDHNGKVRKCCCGNTNEETEDSSHVEADLEDEVIFGEIRYPKENPHLQTIALQNPLHGQQV